MAAAVHLQSPEQAAAWLRARLAGTGQLRTDSRKIAPGDAFLAWPGARVDARSHIDSVLAQGACAVLAEHEGAGDYSVHGGTVATYTGLQRAAGDIASEVLGHPSEQLAVVAVTGTNGKTSTAWWLAQALSRLLGEAARPCAVVGTLGIGTFAIGSGAVCADTAWSETGLTTPDAVTLQTALAQFARQGLRAVAMEASSIGLVQGRLQGTRMAVAVFTNFTQDHLDFHGDMEAYWQAKASLFAWPGLRAAVINVDDGQGAALAHRLTNGPDRALDVWTVSMQGPARIWAQDVAYSGTGLTLTVCEGETKLPLAAQVIGSYNVSNLLGVIAAQRALGVGLVDAVAACGTLQPVPGRMERVGGRGAPLVAVDYAHTPDALAQALQALRPMAAQRGGALWCVFGCGGDRDTAKRPLMGAIAARDADAVVVTSDNPRSEVPACIIAQILLGAPHAAHVQVQADRALAIAHAITHAARDDVVLIAGKGHETTQEVAGTKTPFSDRGHALQALAARAANQEVAA